MIVIIIAVRICMTKVQNRNVHDLLRALLRLTTIATLPHLYIYWSVPFLCNFFSSKNWAKNLLGGEKKSLIKEELLILIFGGGSS